MRKTSKSSLYPIFPVMSTAPCMNDMKYVVDGGFLLRKMRWSRELTYGGIAKNYVQYIQKMYGKNCVIVFDGYEGTSKSSTKVAEQKR